MMNKNKVTEFQSRVYAATSSIPRGMVTTYKLLGASIGCNCSQAVGQALRRNPFAPKVPCHRVVSSDLTIGGFAGDIAGKNISKKLKLLAAEGVKFIDGKLVDSSRIYRF